jgi:hypothetical protein
MPFMLQKQVKLLIYASKQAKKLFLILKNVYFGAFFLLVSNKILTFAVEK